MYLLKIENLIKITFHYYTKPTCKEIAIHKIEENLHERFKEIEAINKIQNNFYIKLDSINLNSLESLQLLLNEINEYILETTTILKEDHLFRIIKMYGKEETKEKHKLFLNEKYKTTQNFSFFIVDLMRKGPTFNQQELNERYKRYVSLINKMSEAESKYYGFVLSLTLQDFIVSEDNFTCK